MGTTPSNKKRRRPQRLARLIHSTASRNGATTPMAVRAIRAAMTERKMDDALISLKKAEWNCLRVIVGKMTYYMIEKILNDLPSAIEEARGRAGQRKNRRSVEQRIAALARHMVEASARHGARKLP